MRSRAVTSKTTPALNGRKIIVAVGINRYRAWSPLHNAINDAKGALRVFEQLGFEQIVAPMFDEAATSDTLRYLVTDELATLGSEDSLVLFFAGHGHTQIRTLPCGPVQTGFLIPIDGDHTEGRTATWIRLDTWLSDVARLPARHILVILDACHSGIALGPLIKWRDIGSTWHGDSLDELHHRQSRRIITSALSDQQAMDGGPIDGHSLFTGCLIEGLTGGLARDGRHLTTGSEIGVYVRHRVTSYPGSRQTPDFGTFELDDRGELVVPLLTASRPLQPASDFSTGTSHHQPQEVIANALDNVGVSRYRTRTAVLGMTMAIVLGALVAFGITQHRPEQTASPCALGPPEGIAQSDDQPLAVTMLHDGRYLRIEGGVVTVIAADGTKSRALPTPVGLTPIRARPSNIDGWAEVYATGASCSWWLIPIDGTAWRPLLDDPSCNSEVDLSPDGTQLAIARAGELRIRHLVIGTERTLLNNAHGAAANGRRTPTWSPDGKRLVLDGEISIIDIASGTEIHHGRVGSAACWLEVDRVVYVTRTWLHSELHLLDLRTGTDRIALEMEGAIWDLAVWNGGLLIRRDEFHGRTYFAPVSLEHSPPVDLLDRLDTGSAIDFFPVTWAPDGSVITLASVAGQRGLVRTLPGQRGTPLVLHHARNIVLLGNTQQQVIYSFSNDDDCEIRIFDLGTGKDQLWRRARCAQQPYITCARSRSRCLVIDDAGPRWFDPSAIRFEGPAPHFELDEALSPDAAASVRVRGTIVIRDLASDAETVIAAPPVSGPFEVDWGSDSNTLIAMTSGIAVTPTGHHQMLIGTRDGRWRTLIDEPHRSLNGYTVSPDGSRIAIVALRPASTWSYLPFVSPQRR